MPEWKTSPQKINGNIRASGNLYISAIIELKTCYIILGFIKKEIKGKKEQLSREFMFYSIKRLKHCSKIPLHSH